MLYSVVLVSAYININQPLVYTCSLLNFPPTSNPPPHVACVLVSSLATMSPEVPQATSSDHSFFQQTFHEHLACSRLGAELKTCPCCSVA